MNSIDFIKQRLNSKWTDSNGYEFTLTSGVRIQPEELHTLENRLGVSFPNDYIQFVTEIGLCRLDGRWEGKGDPSTFFSMLAPDQIAEIISAYKIWTDEYTYFDEDEQEIKKVQQSIRNILIPFQYFGDETAWNFYCFVPNKIYYSKLQVIVAYHDDDELDCWFQGDKSDKIWGFDEHIIDWIKSSEEQ